jgi:hypothetical protein
VELPYTLSNMVKNLEYLFEWNIALALMIVSYQPIMLAACVQMYAFNTDTTYAVVNFVLGLIFLIISIAMPVIITYNFRQTMKTLDVKMTRRTHTIFLKQRKIIYDQFDRKSKANPYLIFIVIVRGFLIVPSLVYAQYVPELTVAYYVIFSLVTFIFLMHKYPFKGKKNNIFLIVYEVLLLKVYFLVMNFGLRTDQSTTDMNTRFNNGWATIIVIFLVIVAMMIEAIYDMTEFVLVHILGHKKKEQVTGPKKTMVVGPNEEAIFVKRKEVKD